MEFNSKIPANIQKFSRNLVLSGIKHLFIRTYANVLSLKKIKRIPTERCRTHFLLIREHLR